MHRASDHGAIAAGDAHGHHHGLCRAGRAVVHAGVRDVHAGKFADHGLELEKRLQCALRDLRLVGRVAGQKFATLREHINQHRPVVAVGARAQKAGVSGGVLRGKGFEGLHHFLLAVLTRNVQVAGEAEFFRNGREQVVDRDCTDIPEHRFTVGGRLWQIAHKICLSYGVKTGVQGVDWRITC